MGGHSVLISPSLPSAAPGGTRYAVRPMRPSDFAAVVDLRRLIWQDDLMTPASLAWSLEHVDPEGHARHWVATEPGGDRASGDRASGDRVVGFAVAGLASWSSGRVGYAYVGVHPEWRRNGIGRRLFRRTEAYLATLQPARVVTGSELGDEASTAFLARRGFSHTRDDQAWSLDPRTADLDEFEPRREAAESAGRRLVPLRELMGRPGDLYRIHLALEHDLPGDMPVAQSYDTWRRCELGHPLFSPDASFCVLVANEPVAMTWILVDEAGRRARHGITGTVRPYRHRGLARLVKLASIHWLAEHGTTALYTDNDTENHNMVALNEELGFRPLTVFALWRRGEGTIAGRASAAATSAAAAAESASR